MLLLHAAASCGLHTTTVVSRHSRVLCTAAGGDSRWMLVTSATNARLKLVKKLHSRRQREKHGMILLEGHRLILDALGAGLLPEFVVLHDEALDDDVARGPQLRAALEALEPNRVLRAPMNVVEALADTQTPQGVIAVLPQPSLPMPERPSLVLVCDAVSDPGNLGTLLRSAAGAGVGAALLTAGCSDAWGLKVLRAGMGAHYRLPLRSVHSWADASRQLATWGVVPLAADAAGESAHFEVDWSPPSALVVGSEAHGLSPEVRADPMVRLCRIPLEASMPTGGGAGGEASGVESLNAAVAGSIILFEAQRQRLTSGTSRAAA